MEKLSRIQHKNKLKTGHSQSLTSPLIQCILFVILNAFLLIMHHASKPVTIFGKTFFQIFPEKKIGKIWKNWKNLFQKHSLVNAIDPYRSKTITTQHTILVSKTASRIRTKCLERTESNVGLKRSRISVRLKNCEIQEVSLSPKDRDRHLFDTLCLSGHPICKTVSSVGC